MKSALIGYTGFVGTNLRNQHTFSNYYNSKNINEIQGKEFDLVVCAGVRAEKWKANLNSKEDFDNIAMLKENIASINVNHFVLISTIDIYDNKEDSDESVIPDSDKQDVYGKNRFELELWIKKQFDNCTIIRLPGLFGNGLKKNFIFDMLNPQPKFFTIEAFENLKDKISNSEMLFLKKYYQPSIENIFKLSHTDNQLKRFFINSNLSSLYFTDSRSKFQYYNLDYLWKDIGFTLQNKIEVINITSEPIQCSELVKYITGDDFINHKINRSPIEYNIKSIYSDKWNGKEGYTYQADAILKEIKGYIKLNS